MSKTAVDCPACGSALSVPTDILGRKVKCPKCQEIVRLPTADVMTAANRVAPTDSAPAGSSADKSGPKDAASDAANAKPSPAKPSPAKPSPAKPSSTVKRSPAVKSDGGEPVVSQPDQAMAAPVSPPTSEPSPAQVAATGPRVMAKPVVPMAKVLGPATASPATSVATPGAATPGAATPGAAATAGPIATSESLGIDPSAVVEKPRLKFRRKRTSPWPAVLLGSGALVVLGALVWLVIWLFPNGMPAGAQTALPEIQYVNDATIEVGKTVRIPISVYYPEGYTPADKLNWQLKLGEKNPVGAAWDSVGGQLTWTPTTRDAGKSFSLSMIIQNKQTQEPNLTTFQVHVPALAPALMSVIQYWDQQGVEYQLALPQSSQRMGLGDAPSTSIDLSLGGVSVRAYGYPNPESAQQRLAQLQSDPPTLVELGLAIDEPLHWVQRESLILVGNRVQVEQDERLREWFGLTAATETTESETPPPPRPTISDEDAGEN
jgi:DNA-directed RNA polymerase subunit M/transcription elongation factor TFIIS